MNQSVTACTRRRAPPTSRPSRMSARRPIPAQTRANPSRVGVCRPAECCRSYPRECGGAILASLGRLGCYLQLSAQRGAVKRAVRPVLLRLLLLLLRLRRLRLLLWPRPLVRPRRRFLGPHKRRL